VGALVRKLHGENRRFESLSLEEWRAASELFDQDVVSRVAPRASAAAKKTPQSTAPDAVHARLAEIQGWLRGL
jgi:argininosuccinate lyase